MHYIIQDNKVRLTLSGRIDLASRQQLRAVIEAGLSQGCTSFTFDLHEVHCIDSAGFGALIACRGAVQKHGGTLTLTRLPKQVYELMELTKLTQFFTIDDAVPVVISGVESSTL